MIHAAVVMPNHCHLLLRNMKGVNHMLAEHLGIVKGYTAREANRILGLKGSFWQSENFDHWCRSTEKFQAAIRYIRNNPVKAGLVRKPEEWKWLR
jgi:REP element-mobilizing transposase RayT